MASVNKECLSNFALQPTAATTVNLRSVPLLRGGG